MATYFDHIKMSNPIDVCYSIVENFYRGNSSTQLRVKDLRERDELV
jgi:single-stranded-DNA-specific exonuclease